MKKLFVNLSLAAAAAIMLTACAGNQSGRGANPGTAAETAAVSDVGTTAAAPPKPSRPLRRSRNL